MTNFINNTNTMNFARILAEDINAPELRNPKISGMKPLNNWFKSLFHKKNG